MRGRDTRVPLLAEVLSLNLSYSERSSRTLRNDYCSDYLIFKVALDDLVSLRSGQFHRDSTAYHMISNGYS